MLVVLALVALAAHIHAAAAAPATPAAATAAPSDLIDLAVRYADALTGADDDADDTDDGEDEADADDSEAEDAVEAADDDEPAAHATVRRRSARAEADAAADALDATGSDAQASDSAARLAVRDAGTSADEAAIARIANEIARELRAGAAGTRAARDREREMGAAEDENLSVGGDDGDGERAGLATPGTGALAVLDAEQSRFDAIAAADAGTATASVGAAERYEAELHGGASSWLGRVDVSVAWQRRWSAPLHTPAHLSDELWLTATWRP